MMALLIIVYQVLVVLLSKHYISGSVSTLKLPLILPKGVRSLSLFVLLITSLSGCGMFIEVPTCSSFGNHLRSKSFSYLWANNCPSVSQFRVTGCVSETLAASGLLLFIFWLRFFVWFSF